MYDIQTISENYAPSSDGAQYVEENFLQVDRRIEL